MSHQATALPDFEMGVIPKRTKYTKASGNDNSQNGNQIRQPMPLPSPLSTNTLRQLRLQLLSLLPGRWKTSVEPRKVAIYYNRRIAFLHCLLHLFPLSGAISLLGLQWGKYWVGTSTSMSTFLQFVAKVHELAMQASLAEAPFRAIRTQLIYGYIPLGALSSVTQVTQLSYLWSLDFLSLSRSSAIMSNWKRAALICIIPIILVLTSLVGPSSAILMIPRSDTPHTVHQGTLFSNKSIEEIFPSTLEWPDFTLEMDKLGNTLVSESISEFEDGVNGSVASTMFAYSSCEAQHIQWMQVMHTVRETVQAASDDVLTVAVPTCLSVRSFDRIISDSPYVGMGNRTTSTATLYPAVSTQCIDSTFETLEGISDTNKNIYYLYENGTSRGTLFDIQTLADQISNYKYSDYIDAYMAWTREEIDESGEYVDAGSYYETMTYPSMWMLTPESGSTSLIGIFPHFVRQCLASSGCDGDTRAELPLSLSSMLELPASTKVNLTITTFTISAFWNHGEVQLVEKSGFGTIQTGALAMSKTDNSRPITLGVDKAWILHRPDFYRDTLNFGAKGRELAVLFALSIASKYSDITGTADDADADILSEHYEETKSTFQFNTVLFGYGYGGRPTSVHLAMTVMMLYCTIIVAYIIFSLTTGLTSTAWSSTIEIVMLALQSRKPDYLGNIGVGLNSIETFKEGVGIRVNHDEQLELVFAHDRDLDNRGLRHIERNKVY